MGGDKGRRLEPPNGCYFQMVNARKQGVEKLCLKVTTEENENGAFFIVKPTKPAMPGKSFSAHAIGRTNKPVSRLSGFNMMVRGAGATAEVKESHNDRAARAARKAIGSFVEDFLGDWLRAFKQRAGKPALPPMPTVAALCEEIRKKHPEINRELMDDFTLKGQVGFRFEDYLAENEDFAAAFNTWVIDFVEHALSEWEADFMQRSDNAKPPRMATVIESLCKKIENAHPDLHQQLGREAVRNYVANHVEDYAEQLKAFEMMNDFVKNTLNAWEAGFREQAGAATLPPMPAIIDAVCKAIGQRHPEIKQQLGMDYVKGFVLAYVEKFKTSDTGADVGENALSEWTPAFRRRAVTASLPSTPALIEAQRENAGSAAEAEVDYDNFFDVLARSSENAWVVESGRSSVSSMSSVGSVGRLSSLSSVGSAPVLGD